MLSRMYCLVIIILQVNYLCLFLIILNRSPFITAIQTLDAQGETENMGKYITSYFDSPNEPLFPFDFGLSYTDFNIDFVLSSTEMTKDSEIVVTANIENIVDKLGTQTVQLYLQDITASVSRLVKQLVGFENITLKPHEKGQIKFVIKYNMLKFWNDKMQYVAELGKFNVFIGSDSTTQNKQTFTLLDK